MAKEKRRSASQAGVGTHKQLTKSLPQGAPKPAHTAAKRRKSARGPGSTAGKTGR